MMLQQQPNAIVYDCSSAEANDCGPSHACERLHSTMAVVSCTFAILSKCPESVIWSGEKTEFSVISLCFICHSHFSFKINVTHDEKMVNYIKCNRLHMCHRLPVKSIAGVQA